MTFHVLTLFPELVETILASSITGRAMAKGVISLNCVNMRDYAPPERKGRVDDYPFGGGAGMVIQPEPVFEAWRAVTAGRSDEAAIEPAETPDEAATAPTEASGVTASAPAEASDEAAIEPAETPDEAATAPTEASGVTATAPAEESGAAATAPAEESGVTATTPAEASDEAAIEPTEESGAAAASCPERRARMRTIYLTPQGRTFTQQIAMELAQEEELCFLCGHYEGIDERVIEEIVTDEISIGDYVLTGGEIPAAVVMDAVARMVPGVLSNEHSGEDESFMNSLLEYPQYTRPALWHEKEVPPILLSGHHANVDAWRRQQSIRRTLERRPELLEKAPLDKKDRKFLDKLRTEMEEI